MTPRQLSSNSGNADRTAGSDPCARETEKLNRKDMTMKEPEETKNVFEDAVIFIGAPPIWRNLNQNADDTPEPDASDEPKDPDEERDGSV